MKIKVKQADGSFIEKEMEAGEAIGTIVAQEVAPLNAKIATLEGENARLAEKVQKFESSPAFSRAFGIGTPKMHRDYNVQKQMLALRHAASKSPDLFPAFSQEEETDDFIKGLIDFVQGSVFKNPEALTSMIERNKKAVAGRKAAYAEGTTTTGGFLVAPEYIWDMIQLARSRTFMLDACSVVPMNSNVAYMPKEGTLPSVAWDSEGSVTESEGTFAQVTLTARRLSAYSIASNELLADGSLDIATIIADQFGYAIALELDNQVLNGTGSPVSGLTTAAAGNSVVMSTGKTNFSSQSSDDYSNAIYSLNEADANVARFFINRISKHYLRILKDTQNRPIFAAPGEKTPGTIYEIPYNVSETMSNTTAVSKAFAVLGNWKKYYIGRRLAFGSLEVDPYGKFAEYQTRFRVATRWAFAIGRSDAFCRIMTAAS